MVEATHDVTLALPAVLGGGLFRPAKPGADQKAMRRGHLHHHLPGAGGLYFPAPAQCPRTAHGTERPPYDRAARDVVQGAQDNNIVPMPGKVIDPAPPPSAAVPLTDRWKGVAGPGTPLALGLDAVAAQDTSFDPQHFISGARAAYEMIVLAFANGDRRALKDCCLRSLQSFEAVIRIARNTGRRRKRDSSRSTRPSW